MPKSSSIDWSLAFDRAGDPYGNVPSIQDGVCGGKGSHADCLVKLGRQLAPLLAVGTVVGSRFVLALPELGVRPASVSCPTSGIALHDDCDQGRVQPECSAVWRRVFGCDEIESTPAYEKTFVYGSFTCGLRDPCEREVNSDDQRRGHRPERQPGQPRSSPCPRH